MDPENPQRKSEKGRYSMGMSRVLVLCAAILVALASIVTVAPILEDDASDRYVASVQTGVSSQFTKEPSLSPSCALSAHPSEIVQGGEVSIAWGSENAVSAILSEIGEVPVHGGLFVRPETTRDYLLSVRSQSGEWASCTTSVIVR